MTLLLDNSLKTFVFRQKVAWPLGDSAFKKPGVYDGWQRFRAMVQTQYPMSIEIHSVAPGYQPKIVFTVYLKRCKCDLNKQKINLEQIKRLSNPPPKRRALTPASYLKHREMILRRYKQTRANRKFLKRSASRRKKSKRSG